MITGIVLLSLLLAGCSYAGSADVSLQPGQVLFVYDKVDDGSRPYIQWFRDRFSEMGVPIQETAVEADRSQSPSGEFLVIYSRVLRFDMSSPVRQWIKSVKDFKGGRIPLLVTANRWFVEKHRTALEKLIAQRNGVLVDAVSMATQKMDDAKKVEVIGRLLDRLDR